MDHPSHGSTQEPVSFNSVLHVSSPKYRQDNDNDESSIISGSNSPVIPAENVKQHLFSNGGKSGSSTCKHCKKTFKNARSCSKHHYICYKNPNRSERQLCPKCGTTYSRKTFLDAHLASNNCQVRRERKLCLFPGCVFEYRFKTRFIEHLKHDHKANIQDEVTKEFDSWQGFLDWKAEEEQNTFSYYSKQCGEKGNLSYFYCQRDGSSKSHVKKKNPDQCSISDDNHDASSENIIDSCIGSPKRRKKKGCNVKGRVKLGSLCVSVMKVKKVSPSLIRVIYFPTHSHPLIPNDLKHQPLDEATSEFIKNQIALGVSPEEIIKVLQGDELSRVNQSELPKSTRSDFITLKSLRERQRRILSKDTDGLASDDSTSFELSIQNLQEEPDDPVLIFKPLDSDLTAGPELAKNLPKNSFLVSIHSKEQLESMKETFKDPTKVTVRFSE